MKKYLFLMMFYLVSSVTFAESITNMSKSEADKLLTLLKVEKYLLSGDGCNQGQVSLISIKSAVIETAKETGMYVVKVAGKKVMTFSSDLNGNFSKPVVVNEEVNELLSLNQSALPKEGRGLPAGYFVGREAQNLQLCLDFWYYPYIGEGSIFEPVANTEAYKQYAAWYNENISKHFVTQPFIGTWGVKNICPTASDCKGFPPGINSARLALDVNGNVDLAVDGESNRGKWTYSQGKIIIKDKEKTTNVFGFRIENEILILEDMQNLTDAKNSQGFHVSKFEKLK